MNNYYVRNGKLYRRVGGAEIKIGHFIGNSAGSSSIRFTGSESIPTRDLAILAEMLKGC